MVPISCSSIFSLLFCALLCVWQDRLCLCCVRRAGGPSTLNLPAEWTGKFFSFGSIYSEVGVFFRGSYPELFFEVLFRVVESELVRTSYGNGSAASAMLRGAVRAIRLVRGVDSVLDGAHRRRDAMNEVRLRRANVILTSDAKGLEVLRRGEDEGLMRYCLISRGLVVYVVVALRRVGFLLCYLISFLGLLDVAPCHSDVFISILSATDQRVRTLSVRLSSYGCDNGLVRSAYGVLEVSGRYVWFLVIIVLRFVSVVWGM